MRGVLAEGTPHKPCDITANWRKSRATSPPTLIRAAAALALVFIQRWEAAGASFAELAANGAQRAAGNPAATGLRERFQARAPVTLEKFSHARLP